MFGKPKFSDTAFLMREFTNGMTTTINAMEPDHPNATATDTQGMTVWVFTIILHAVLLWGRTNEQAVGNMFAEFGIIMQQNRSDGAWDLDELSGEIERCQRLLRTHASSLNYDGVKEAAASFYRGLLRKEPKPSLSEEDFLRYGVTTFLANAARLRDRGHIKLK